MLFGKTFSIKDKLDWRDGIILRVLAATAKGSRLIPTSEVRRLTTDCHSSLGGSDSLCLNQ